MVETKVSALVEEARAEMEKVLAMGGAVAAVENAYMKQQLVASHTRRSREIESGEMTVVGVNQYTEAEPSLLATGAGSILVVDESAEREQIERLEAFRNKRVDADVAAALHTRP